MFKTTGWIKGKRFRDFQEKRVSATNRHFNYPFMSQLRNSNFYLEMPSSVYFISVYSKSVHMGLKIIFIVGKRKVSTGRFLQSSRT